MTVVRKESRTAMLFAVISFGLLSASFVGCFCKNEAIMIRYPSQAAWALVWSVCLTVCAAESARAEARNRDRDVVRDRASSWGMAGRRWAVLIALDEYDDARIPDLRFCSADAQLVA